LELLFELGDLGLDLTAVFFCDFEGFDFRHAAVFGVLAGLGGGGFEGVIGRVIGGGCADVFFCCVWVGHFERWDLSLCDLCYL